MSQPTPRPGFEWGHEDPEAYIPAPTNPQIRAHLKRAHQAMDQAYTAHRRDKINPEDIANE